MANQPLDEMDNPIPVLGLGATTLRTFTAASAATAVLVTGSAPKVFTLFADQDCYVATGAAGVTVTSSGFLLRAATYFDVALTGVAPCIAALRATADGTLRITERT